MVKAAGRQRTPKAILDIADFDFFALLDAVTIARSRRHITTFYDPKEIGEFPTRRKPLSFRARLHTARMLSDSTISSFGLTLLKLGVYTPVSYILPSRIAKYEAMYDTEVSSGGGTLKQKDREQSLRALMTVNLLKRLESSVASFRITLQKLQGTHLATLLGSRIFGKREARARLRISQHSLRKPGRKTIWSSHRSRR